MAACSAQLLPKGGRAVAVLLAAATLPRAPSPSRGSAVTQLRRGGVPRYGAAVLRRAKPFGRRLRSLLAFLCRVSAKSMSACWQLGASSAATRR